MQKKVANAGSSIADPLARAERMVIQHGRFWKRGARADIGEGEKGGREKSGGFSPTANHTNATMDWTGAAEPARGGVLRANALGGGIINARLDSLNTSLSAPPFVGYVGSTGMAGGMITNTGTSTTPRVTCSGVTTSKSYSPASMLAK